MSAPPEPTRRTARRAEIVAAARRLLEAGGRTGVSAGVTMRELAAEVGMQAPSLYKHFPTKRSVEAALIEQGLRELGDAMHEAVAEPAADGPVSSLLRAYRAGALANPALYRLAAAGPLPRDELPPGLEDWAGEPFFLATGDPWRAQALWAFAHGMVVLELDDRFLAGSDLDRTWRSGAAAFAARSG